MGTLASGKVDFSIFERETGSMLVLSRFAIKSYWFYWETQKYTDGYILKVGGGVVSWMSRLHNIITLLTTEAKYAALAKAAKEMI